MRSAGRCRRQVIGTTSGRLLFCALPMRTEPIRAGPGRANRERGRESNFTAGLTKLAASRARGGGGAGEWPNGRARTSAALTMKLARERKRHPDKVMKLPRAAHSFTFVQQAAASPRPVCPSVCPSVCLSACLFLLQASQRRRRLAIRSSQTGRGEAKQGEASGREPSQLLPPALVVSKYCWRSSVNSAFGQ